MLICALLLASGGRGALAAPRDGQAAALVLGQPDLTSAATALSSAGLSGPIDAGFDSSGDLWVADAYNSRVLEFTPPFADGASAVLVLGQPDMTSSGQNASAAGMSNPSALTFDSAGDLWVSDLAYNRLLEFRPPFTNGMQAHLVLGQPDFTATASTASPTGMDSPDAAAFDGSGDLWVADANNSRVLEFAPPFADGMAAALVLGQHDLYAHAGGTGAAALSFPTDCAFAPGGQLWVADSENNRILEFAPPLQNGMKAGLVLGQPDLAMHASALGPAGLFQPRTVSFGPSGDLWVSDRLNNRVLEFSPPLSDGMEAALVLGQPDFTSARAAASAGSLYGPIDALSDASGHVWVVDNNNSRVLEFVPAAPEEGSAGARAAAGVKRR